MLDTLDNYDDPIKKTPKKAFESINTIPEGGLNQKQQQEKYWLTIFNDISIDQAEMKGNLVKMSH